MRRASLPPWSSHAPCGTITAVRMDPCSEADSDFYDLARHRSARIGGGRLATPHAPPEVTHHVRTPICSYDGSGVSTPEIWGGRCGNHSRTGSGKAMDNRRRIEPVVRSSSGYRRRTTPVPGGRTGPAIHPRSKRRLDLAPRYSALERLRGQCRLTLGEPWTPGPSRLARPRPFRRSQLCYPVLASATGRPFSVRSRLGPNVTASLPSQESELT